VGLHPIDGAIIVGYFILILTLGVYLERRAEKNLESYFLGGRSIPWWMLGMSGSSTYFDISGTMWMVSVFYVLGMLGMWQHAFWGFPFAGILLAYKAKWAYRSGVLTSMEWLIFRYGAGRAGQSARLMTIIIALTGTVLMLGYAGIGIAKFVEVFVPIDRNIVVPLIFGFTGLYVILSGFFGVVYSDFIQTLLLSFAAVYISLMAFLRIDPAAFQAAVGQDWTSLKPVMTLSQPSPDYVDLFGLLIAMWVFKGLVGLLAASGGPEFQRCRAARTEAEACKIGLAWGLVISVRWCMVMAFTVFGLSILAGQGAAVDSERVLPMMINEILPVGIKGLVLAGLLAAFMSTFDSTLNVAASYIVNDMVKPVWKTAGPRALVYVSYVATLVIVLLGIVISMYTEHIAAIWNPINFALGSALIAPAVLAAYWWRISGWAVCMSGACTLPAAFYVKAFTEMRELQYFPLLAGISLAACLAGAYLFPPTPEVALKNYYRKVRPFGAWGPVRRMLAAAGEDPRRFARDRYDIPVAIGGTVFFIMLYIFMMDLVLHNWPRVVILGTGLLGLALFLYVFWWRVLGAEGEMREVNETAFGRGDPVVIPDEAR
jgi:solute:Na+ symporter, SSS family